MPAIKHTAGVLALIALLAGCNSSLMSKSDVAKSDAANPAIATAGAESAEQYIDAQQADAEDDYPVIAHMETRDKFITYKSSPRGVLYFVKSKDGKVLADHLTGEQLQAQNPDLHFEITHMMADF